MSQDNLSVDDDQCEKRHIARMKHGRKSFTVEFINFSGPHALANP